MTWKFQKYVVLLAASLAIGPSVYAAPTQIGSLTISGVEQQSSTGAWDTGTVTATINGVSVSVKYGQYSSSASVASALAATISQNCNSQVYARATGGVINFYKKGTYAITSARVTSTSDNPSAFSNQSFLVDGLGDILPPQITGLSLTEGPPLVGLVITGVNFGSGGTVTIGGVAALVVPNTWTSTSITVQIPANLTPGTVADVVVSTWITNLGQSYTFNIDSPFDCN